jgi:hypothetical protein
MFLLGNHNFFAIVTNSVFGNFNVRTIRFAAGQWRALIVTEVK